jgi:glycosyltransferase involved in cell wall biosynthesis
MRERVQVYYVGPMHIRQTTQGKGYYHPLQLLMVVFFSTLRLTWYALRTPSDVIFLGKAQPMNGVAGLLVHQLRRVPLWLDCDDYETGSNRFAGRGQRRVVAWFESHLPKRVERISVNTEFMHSYVLARGVAPERVRLIPNGVERERFGPVNSAEVERLREQWHLRDRRCVIYVGSLSLVNHAVDILLVAFAGLVHDLPDTVLVIVGSGEDEAALRKQVERLGLRERVCFVGAVPANQVPLYYHLAEVSVDPVRDDEASQARSPLKLFESWAAGIPFVTGDVGDRRTLLAGGAAGVLVAPGDPIALGDGIKQVLRDLALAKSLRENGLLAVEQFWWDVLVRDWMNNYEH